MRRPRVFRLGSDWAIEFMLDGRRTHWRTPRWTDAIAFALNLWTLRACGLRRL